MPLVDPRRRSWLNISKHAESSTDILNEFHRPRHNDTNCQRPRNGRDFDKNESTIVKMNASCTICAITKRRCIKLAKIFMDNSPSYSLKSSVIMADFRSYLELSFPLHCIVTILDDGACFLVTILEQKCQSRKTADWALVVRNIYPMQSLWWLFGWIWVLGACDLHRFNRN